MRRMRLRAADLTMKVATWLAEPSGYHGEWVSRTTFNWIDEDEPYFPPLAEIDERNLEAAKTHPGIRRFAEFSRCYLRQLKREGRA